MDQGLAPRADKPGSPENNEKEKIGILTKTIVPSPVIHWTLHARIRQKNCNDVVFVGDDFIHVKQVKDNGPLLHIATKDDFDSRIRAAKTFSNETEVPDEDLFIKVETGDSSLDATVPPQCLVLTLDSNDLVFLYLANDGARGHRFVQQSCPLPTFDRVIFQPGEHLAIDPHSRALAVAANEREVVIYSAKSKERIQRELKDGYRDWCPVSAQRPMQIEGAIQQMDFLIPPTDNRGSEDTDHIILLLILVDQGRTRAVWIDWYYSSDLHHAQIHPAQPLDSPRSVPSLLIPLRNAAFMLLHGSEIKRWKDILSGSATSSTLQSLAVESSYPGASTKRPVWANWCRPRRGGAARNSTDHIYLVREDGQVYLMQVSDDKVETSNAGDFGCHVGTAFASLGDSRDPDILAVAGDMSNGRIQSIGSWFTALQVPEVSSRDAMEMDLIETIPNWASVTDMVTTTLPGKSERPRDGVFVTSGRQPYGAITELRRGLEARLSAYFELDGLKSVTDVWALPFTAVGHILVVLSSPAGTRLLDISADAEMESIEEVDGSSVGLDSTQRTLAASATPDGKIIQITERSICVTPGASINFEDCARIDYASGSAILAAAIDTERSIAIVAERLNDGHSEYALVCYALHTDDANASGEGQVERRAVYDLESEPLCLSIFLHSSETRILVATAAGQLCAFALEEQDIIKNLSQHRIPSAEDHNMCDSVAVMQSKSSSSRSDVKLLAVCGLRNGWLCAVMLDPSSPNMFGDQCFVRFGQTTAKLTQPEGSNSIAYATSGSDVCLLSWNGQDVQSLDKIIQSIWVSDKLRPELSQGPVTACTHMPAAHLISSPDLADSLIMISGNDFLVASLDRTPAAIPRQIPVSGTPNRLIYLEQHRCLVSASLRYDVRSFPSSLPHAKPEERRQIWPVIDFVPSRNSSPSFTYEMQPGERIYALLEWSFKASENKTYSFLLVGGSYIRSSGSQRGRITFLQPINKGWEVVDVKEGRTLSFDAPVYALTLFSEKIIIACAGNHVNALHFSAEKRKWEPCCAPFELASAGIYVSVSFHKIYVSTAEDSLVHLAFVENDRDEVDTTGFDMRLGVLSMAPRADALICHTLPFGRDVHGNPMESAIALMSTKYGQVLGLDTQWTNKHRHANSTELLFEAQLPRSLTRLRLCNTAPQWRRDCISGVYSASRVLGSAADGTLVGMAFLTEDWWRRLSWLQRLCEWSAELSPHSYQYPAYNVSERTYSRDERAMPIGLSGSGRDEIAMKTRYGKMREGHIDGDVLARLLAKGGVETLKGIIRQTAERDDRAGLWVRNHLEDELNAVEEVLGLVRDMLNLWL